MAYDLIVIGAGPGGYVAGIRAAQLGMKVLVVEKEHLGGICLNWGCIPSKALLKSAEVYEHIKEAEKYGIKVGEYKPDFPAIIKRSREVAQSMNRGIEYLFRKYGVEWVQALGRLLPEQGKVEITHAESGRRETLEAKHIIIATGARARQLPFAPFDDEKIFGYKRGMSLDKQPGRLVVIGAGAIGVEFAYFYNAIGTEVTLIEALDRLVPLEDEEISKELERAFRKKGIRSYTSARVEKIEKGKDGCKVHFTARGKSEQVECDCVLVAIGVEPLTEGLGVEELGIEKTEKGHLKVNEWYQTSRPGYYAIGDVIATPALAHVASHEGIVCVEKIAGVDTHPIDYERVPSCTYCKPEIASVGLTEQQAKERGYEVVVGKFPFTASGKAKASGHTEGLVKLVFDRKYGELLGAHMIGDSVTEMVAELVVAKELETTMQELYRAMHPHPTLSEAIMEAAAASENRVIHI